MRARWLLVPVALAALSCQPSGGVTTPPAERSGDALSEELLVALSQARNFHHQADVHQAEGNTEGAISALRRILTIHFPAGAPEAEDTFLDARARLAKIYLGAGRFDDAEQVIAEGLAAPRRESFFLANLWSVKGEWHEARAKRLDGEGDAASARGERQAAITAYDRSIQINEALQKRLYRLSKEGQP